MPKGTATSILNVDVLSKCEFPLMLRGWIREVLHRRIRALRLLLRCGPAVPTLSGRPCQRGCCPSPELDEQPLCQVSWERQILAQEMRGSESQSAVKRHFFYCLGLGTK